MRYAIRSQDRSPTAPPRFWESVSYELFSNLCSLYEAIDTFFSLRSAEEGYPAMLVFCVYICGSLASYLWKWPSLCPSLASGAEKMLQRSLEVLADLNHAWPQAQNWLEALQKVSVPSKASKGQERSLSDMSSQEQLLTDAVRIFISSQKSKLFLLIVFQGWPLHEISNYGIYASSSGGSG
jgi:hypothetical protein